MTSLFWRAEGDVGALTWTWCRGESAATVDKCTNDVIRRGVGGVALGKLGTAADLVGPIAFFLGPGAAYVTGQTISADGGSTMLG